jgi:hypothetical protein
MKGAGSFKPDFALAGWHMRYYVFDEKRAGEFPLGAYFCLKQKLRRRGRINNHEAE